MKPKIDKYQDFSDWIEAQKKMVYPARLPVIKKLGLTPSEVTFSLLLFCGMQQADAYLFAFATRANRGSAAQLANRRAKDPKIAKFLEKLYDAEFRGKLKFFTPYVG